MVAVGGVGRESYSVRLKDALPDEGAVFRLRWCHPGDVRASSGIRKALGLLLSSQLKIEGGVQQMERGKGVPDARRMTRFLFRSFFRARTGHVSASGFLQEREKATLP